MKWSLLKLQTLVGSNISGLPIAILMSHEKSSPSHNSLVKNKISKELIALL